MLLECWDGHPWAVDYMQLNFHWDWLYFFLNSVSNQATIIASDWFFEWFIWSTLKYPCLLPESQHSSWKLLYQCLYSTEPVGGSPPKFPSDDLSKSIQRKLQTSTTMICPAQASPSPSFRYVGFTCACVLRLFCNFVFCFQVSMHYCILRLSKRNWKLMIIHWYIIEYWTKIWAFKWVPSN